MSYPILNISNQVTKEIRSEEDMLILIDPFVLGQNIGLRQYNMHIVQASNACINTLTNKQRPHNLANASPDCYIFLHKTP